MFHSYQIHQGIVLYNTMEKLMHYSMIDQMIQLELSPHLCCSTRMCSVKIWRVWIISFEFFSKSKKYHLFIWPMEATISPNHHPDEANKNQFYFLKRKFKMILLKSLNSNSEKAYRQQNCFEVWFHYVCPTEMTVSVRDWCPDFQFISSLQFKLSSEGNRKVLRQISQPGT